MRGHSAKRVDNEYSRTFGGGFTALAQDDKAIAAQTESAERVAGEAGGWEDVVEDDYYSKNAVKNLDETKRKEIESLG